MPVAANNTRLDRDLGGGPLHDIGIYCINAARAVFAAEPTEVWASRRDAPDEARFAEVRRPSAAVLRFPGDRLAIVHVQLRRGRPLGLLASSARRAA